MTVERANRGNALSEYGLTGGLVAVASVAALTLLGGNLNDLFANMLGGTGGKVAAVAGTSPTAGTVLNSASPDTSSQMIQLSSGTRLNLSNYPVQLTKSVQTAGTNGTTEMVLANLQSVARQLLDAGQMNEAQFSLMTQLANKGHEMAAMEKVVEDSYAAHPHDPNGFLATPVTYQGQQYLPVELMGQNLGLSTDAHGNIEVGGATIREFLNLKSQLDASGTLDPVAAQTVTAMSNQIANLANALETTVDCLAANGPPETLADRINSLLVDNPEILGDNEPPPIVSGTVAQATNSKAATICTTGGAADTGAHCK